MSRRSPAAKVRPLQVRPGARFECRGDGLCCADVHLWGPITEREASQLSVISEEVVVRRPSDGTWILQANQHGRCMFWSDGCRLHAALGPLGKPRTCRKFPFSLTATPRGGRVGTSHRCSCSALPSDVPVTAESAMPSLLDAAGRLHADRRVEDDIPLSPRKRVPFAVWEDVEASLLGRLATGEPEGVLARAPFPPLRVGTWREVGEALLAPRPETRFEHALCWFGDALLAHHEGREPPERARPWSDAFDAAERQAPERPARAIFADWIADSIWNLEWTEGRGSWELARMVLATRLAVARRIAARLERDGTRPDRAAAEAVLVSDLTGVSESWSKALRALG